MVIELLTLGLMAAPGAPGAATPPTSGEAPRVASRTGAPVDTIVYRGDRGQLEVRVPRVDRPDIRVDGVLDESAWAGAAVLTGFTQWRPLEGIPASQETRVRVLYGPDALYFGIVAYEEDPSGIRATLTERDGGVTEDDWVRILLDTYGDRSQAYAFYVNPRGVQADGLWLVGGEGEGGGFGVPIDFNPDFLWDSDARITDDGWVAELRIPYESLRFPASPVQRWGINVGRAIERTEYESSWAPLTRNAANALARSGTLVGMEGLEPHRLVELNPVATGRRTGERAPDGAFIRDDFEPSFGLNARYELSRSLMLDATVNPDFSQIEADEGQVEINERFALFFSEKRPFFLEGTEVFSTPQELVYTRAIVDPAAGAKLTGRVGGFRVGYLGALDESPERFGTGSDDALFNLVRLRRDVGHGSTVGVLYTDRSLLDGSRYNRVASADARLVLADRYSLTAQLAGSWTRDPLRPDAFAGPLFQLELERSGRRLSWEVEIEDIHPDFRAESGFIRRIGEARVGADAKYTFYGPPGALLEDISPELGVEAYYHHDDLWAGRRYFEARLEAGLDISLLGPNGGVITAHTGYFDFASLDYTGYERPSPGGGYEPFAAPPALHGLEGITGFARARPVRWLNLNVRGGYQEVPIYDEGGRGTQLALTPTASMRLRGGLSGDASFTYARIVRDDGSRFSLARIPRLKLQYQFTRALFVRAIAEYNLQDRDALRDPAGLPLRVGGRVSEPLDDGAMRYDLLVSYEPSPGTILYAGWTQQREGPNTYRLDRHRTMAEGLFVKVSYLFRL